MQALGPGTFAALLLAGCAQLPPALHVDQPLDVATIPATQLALSLEAAAPLMTVADEPLFAGELSLQAIDALLNLKTGYVLRAGDLLTPAEAQRWRDNLLPTTLGHQRIGQEAQVQLPIADVAPLTLVLRDERESLWLDEADIDTRRHGIDLSWAPAFAKLQLEWDLAALPWDARSALDCPLRGRLAMPLPASAWRAELGGRTCTVGAAPDRPLPADAQTWSAGLHWQTSAHRAGVRVLTVAAAMQDSRPPARAFEVGLDHEHRLGSWTAHGGLAWRQTAADAGELQDWSMDAGLRRQLGDIAVSALWQSGDRYWFVPDYAVPTENLALNLDLSEWLARRWPIEMPSLQLSYNLHSGAGNWQDESLQWRLWMPW